MDFETTVLKQPFKHEFGSSLGYTVFRSKLLGQCMNIQIIFNICLAVSVGLDPWCEMERGVAETCPTNMQGKQGKLWEDVI